MKLILASASPRRLSLLKQIGITPFAVRASEIDETPLKQENPRLYAKRLALEKARACFCDQDEVILAADTVVAVGLRILPKAENKEDVKACLTLLSGRSHRVYTAVCIRQNETYKVKISETRVKVKRLSLDEFNAYCESDEGLGKAGGYAIQGLFERYIEQIIGTYSNVVGLPLNVTANLLSQFK